MHSEKEEREANPAKAKVELAIGVEATVITSSHVRLRKEARTPAYATAAQEKGT